MPLLIDAVTNTHGEARYMLTGTNDFSYLLDIMIEDDLLVESSDTDNDKSDMLSTYDGYRLKFTMLNMYREANDKDDDTCAICLEASDAKGATCAGIYYDGSAVQTWARWIDEDIWYAAAEDGTPTDPVGEDDSAKWYKFDITMDPSIEVTGNADSSWSVYRFQPSEADDYTKDYRFTPGTDNVKAWIYVRWTDDSGSEDVVTYNFYGGNTVSL